MNTNLNRHLAFFAPSLRGGGAERVMSLLAGAVADRGHRVDLVLAKAEGPLLARIPEGIHVVDLRASRVISGLPALVRYLRRSRPDAMLSAMAYANVVGVAATVISGVRTRVLVSEHSMLSIAISNAAVKRARVLPALMRLTYPRAAGIIAVSEGVADDLASTVGLKRERIRVIYNPVVTEELWTRSQDDLHHPWFQAGEPPVILGVGRLTKAKDFSTLIRAFAILRKNRSARLILLGEGEEREGLRRLAESLGIADDLDMPGFVDNPLPYMRRASLFVLSSRWEGLPTVLIEAMACGCPVISTDCPSGPAEILERGRYGLLVEVGSTINMAQAMERVLVSPEPVDAVARAQQFGLERAVDQYLEAIESAILHDVRAGR